MTAVLAGCCSGPRSDQRAATIPLACLARLQRAFSNGHQQAARLVAAPPAGSAGSSPGRPADQPGA